MSLGSASPGDAGTTAQGFPDCLSQCQFCHLGTSNEMVCDAGWLGDGECDCGCQFADNADCGSNCICSPACDFCWCNTTAQNACDQTWNGDHQCDCACDFVDVDCPDVGPTGACCSADGGCTVTTAQLCTAEDGAYQGNGTSCAQINCAARCAAGCEFCWEGTPREGMCDARWEGDGPCDCACQFTDPDCGPKGACCAPANGYCVLRTEATCTFYTRGVFRGVGLSCAQVDCRRCDPACDWCWMDTIVEHACLTQWASNPTCDCGCQFVDPHCPSGVCGNLVCEENATSCGNDCKDLRAFAAFQNCFNPGQAPSKECFPYVYAAPEGIGLEDFARFADFLSGP